MVADIFSYIEDRILFLYNPNYKYTQLYFGTEG